jgi:hypothetical protein
MSSLAAARTSYRRRQASVGDSAALLLCTYFDIHYLARGLALFRSLCRHWPAFELWALCLDDETHDVLGRLALPGLRPLRLSELLAADPGLAACRVDRSELAFYYTCTAPLMLHVLERAPHAEAVIYVDADLFFFADPAPLLAELATGSILVHRHRLRGRWQREGNGDFNVGLVAHRRDGQALACLRHWREQCLASCDDRPVNDRWGDQQYVEHWPARYSGLVVSQHAGAGVAPWNLADYRLAVEVGGRVTVDSEDLLFFHFHGLAQIGPGLVCTRLARYGVRLGRVARRHIYGPYLREVIHAAALARRNGGASVTPFGSTVRADWHCPLPVGRPDGLGDAVRLLSRIARGDVLLARGDVGGAP